MTTAAKLLARKQSLLERLQENPGPHERYEIKRLLADIDRALDSDGARPSWNAFTNASNKKRQVATLDG